MRKTLFLISLVLSSAACSDAAEYREKTGAPDNSAVPQAVATPTAAAAAAGKLSEENQRYSFGYAWPRQASAIPELAAELQRRAATEQAALKEQADEEWDSAVAGEWEPRQHSYEQEWSVVSDLPGFLSLTGRWSAYSGGAHGIYGLESLVWDRKQGRAIGGIDLFRSPAALDRALASKLCDALNRERADRRGQPVDPASGDEFDACPGVADAVVLVGSSSKRAFDRIGIYFGPYVAGSYAEGEFELNFPVDAAVLDAVKPEYRSAFAAKR